MIFVMRSSTRIWKILAVIYALIFITIGILAYFHGLPKVLTVNDKAGHVILYGIATYLGHRALNRRKVKLGSWSIPVFPTLFAGLTTIDEFCQLLSPNRSFDLGDLAASFFGILIAYGLAELGPPRSRKLKSRNQ